MCTISIINIFIHMYIYISKCICLLQLSHPGGLHKEKTSWRSGPELRRVLASELLATHDSSGPQALNVLLLPLAPDKSNEEAEEDEGQASRSGEVATPRFRHCAVALLREAQEEDLGS